MASPVSKNDLKRYFVSAEAYAPLRQKAKFALRAAKFEARSEEEMLILQALTEVSEDEALFLQSLKSQIIQFDSDKVNEYVTRLIEGTRPKSPIKKEPTTPRRKPTLQIAVPDSDLVISSSLQKVSPVMQGKKAALVAARLMKKPGFTIEVLQNERAFGSFAENVKLALQMGIEDGSEKDLARQIVGVQALLDQCMPFEDALERALGERALLRVINDADLELFKKKNGAATRQLMLEFCIDKWMKIEWPGQKKKVARPSLPEDWTLHRSNSATEEKVFEIAKPMLHARSHTVIGLDDDSIYPDSLRDQQICRRMVEGAVVMKYLFVAAYEKNFPSAGKKKVVDQLIDYYLQLRYTGKKPAELMERCFKEVMESDRKQVLKVFDRLLKDQTLGRLHAAPRKPSVGGLPLVLTEPPFHQPHSATDFIALVAKTKFDFKTTYKKCYSKKERKLIDFLLETSLLMDFMGYDFATAVRYLLPVYGDIDSKAMERVIATTDPLKLEAKPAVGEGTIDEVLESIPFLQDVSLFEFAIEYVRVQLPRLMDLNMVKVAEMLIKIGNRVKHEPLSLEAALRETFSVGGLQRLLNSQDDVKNMKTFRISISNLMPKLYVKHKAFQSRQGFIDLIQAARKIGNGSDPVYVKVAAKLLEAERHMSEKNLHWNLAIQWYFNHESLRVLFDETNDFKNSGAVQQAFNQIIG